jgi:hypothetical protein
VQQLLSQIKYKTIITGLMQWKYTTNEQEVTLSPLKQMLLLHDVMSATLRNSYLRTASKLIDGVLVLFQVKITYTLQQKN